MDENKKEVLRQKAELLLGVLKTKKSLKEGKETCNALKKSTSISKMALLIDSTELKNETIKYLLEAVEIQNQSLNACYEIIDQASELLAELSSNMLDMGLME